VKKGLRPIKTDSHSSPTFRSASGNGRFGSKAEIQTAYVMKSGWTPAFSHATSRLRPSMSVLPSLSRTIGKRSPFALMSAASSRVPDGRRARSSRIRLAAHPIGAGHTQRRADEVTERGHVLIHQGIGGRVISAACCSVMPPAKTFSTRSGANVNIVTPEVVSGAAFNALRCSKL
jgi:hypothetical protein